MTIPPERLCARCANTEGTRTDTEGRLVCARCELDIKEAAKRARFEMRRPRGRRTNR